MNITNVFDLINAADAYAQGYTGKGVTVGVADIGFVNLAHPEFAGKGNKTAPAGFNIENSGFFQAFDEWLEEQDFNGNFPKLEKGKIPISLETLSSGYLYDVDEVRARYRIECRLIYRQEV